MEELNSVTSKKLNPIERMQKLQKAILIADNQNRVRVMRLMDGHSKLSML